MPTSAKRRDMFPQGWKTWDTKPHAIKHTPATTATTARVFPRTRLR